MQVDELDMKIKAKENESVSQERGKIDQLDSLLANQENIQVNIRHIGNIKFDNRINYFFNNICNCVST